MRPFESMVRSLGVLYRLPSNFSVSTVRLPSRSMRLINRESGSQHTSRPWRSKSSPLVPAFSRQTFFMPSGVS